MPDSIDIKAILRDLEQSGGVVIRKYHSRERLCRVLQDGIDSGRTCAFAPLTKAFRLLYNTDGFIWVTQEVNSQLRNHKVILEAGLYDHTHAFVVGPRD